MTERNYTTEEVKQRLTKKLERVNHRHEKVFNLWNYYYSRSFKNEEKVAKRSEVSNELREIEANIQKLNDYLYAVEEIAAIYEDDLKGFTFVSEQPKGTTCIDLCGFYEKIWIMEDYHNVRAYIPII